MDRRVFLTGLVAAPAVILTPGLLMPVKATPEYVVSNYRDGPWSLMVEARRRISGVLYVTYDNIPPARASYKAPFAGLYEAAICLNGEPFATFPPEELCAGDTLHLSFPPRLVRA